MIEDLLCLCEEILGSEEWMWMINAALLAFNACLALAVYQAWTR